MEIINYSDYKNLVNSNSFKSENPAMGFLKVQAFTAYGAIPIPNTSIIITKDIDNYKVVFFQGVTNSSGIIENIELPAPIAVKTASPLDVPKYTLYDMTAINEGYETLKRFSIAMFGDVKVIQYVKMTPNIVLGGENMND